MFQTNHPDDDNEGELVSPYRLMNGRLVRQTKAILAKLRRNILDTAVQNLSSLLRDFPNINSCCQLSFWVSVTWHKHSHSQSREEKCSLQHVLLLPQGLINNNPAKLKTSLTCLCIPPPPRAFCPKPKYWWGPFCPCSPISSSSSESEVRIIENFLF